MNAEQAKTLVREIEELLRQHGVFYTKEIEYREQLAYIRFKEISFKVDSR